MEQNKKKRFQNLKTGFFVFLPFVLFVVIIIWIIKLLLGSVSWIIELLPTEFVQKWTPMALDALSIVILLFVVWFVGVVVNHYYLGTKLKNWFMPVIQKIPLLNTLFKISSQVKTTLETSNSFKSVVLLEYPSAGIFSLGFVTNENVEVFAKKIGKDGMIAVFIPTAPNPANGNLVLVQKNKVISTDVPVATAIGYVVSMGTAGATEKVLSESQESPVSQWDSFFINIIQIQHPILFYHQPPQPHPPPHPDENHPPNDEPQLNHHDELYDPDEYAGDDTPFVWLFIYLIELFRLSKSPSNQSISSNNSGVIFLINCE